MTMQKKSKVMNSNNAAMAAVLFAILVCAIFFRPSAALGKEESVPSITNVTSRLESGKPVRIVCFGDSITGVYYHTGSQRAWCDMLGIALGKAYPKSSVEMINSGISGHTTVNALARIEKDVVALKPDLVVVMFGMNDVTRVKPQVFQKNIKLIAQRCLDAGSAVILCTPNSVYNNTSRPNTRLKEFSQRVKQVGGELNLTVVDFFEAWQTLRKKDETAWMLLMSDTIHPNLNGHKRFAELITRAISGKDVHLGNVEATPDALHKIFDQLKTGNPAKLVAMPPFDILVPDMMKELFPKAQFQVTTWPSGGKTVDELSEWAKRIRSMAPHLVVVAVPAAATSSSTEQYIRSYGWVLNWSFQFGHREWDVIHLLPPLADLATEINRERYSLARQIVIGKDHPLLKQNKDASLTVKENLAKWISARHKQWAKPAAIHFSEHLIADKYAYPYGIAAADIDKDGDLDLTSADYQPHNKLYLFENDSRGNFKRHLIQKNDPERLERHMIGDVDGDGDLDVVIVKNLRGHLLWFENSGKPSDGNLWKRHVITTKLPGAYDVALADFNRDGRLDVAASSWILGNQFAWFENDGTPADGPWKKRVIEKDTPETRTMRAADFDGDGDADLLGTVRRAHAVVWYENRAQAGSVIWQKHFIDNESRFPAHGNPADMDGDGDMDVVMALGFYFKPDSKDPHASRKREDNQIVWYENDGTPAMGPWKKHIIQPQFNDAFEAIAGDLDGDGDIDVAATSWRNPGRVVWFENHGKATGKWTQHLLKKNWRSANQIIIADLNGDGKLDITACAEHGSYEFRWWRNEGRPTKK